MGLQSKKSQNTLISFFITVKIILLKGLLRSIKDFNAS